MRKLLLLALVLTSLTGAGCSKKKPEPAPAPQPKPASANPAVVAFGTTQTGDAAINAELDAILKNFRQVKSFRMRFSYSTPQGLLTSTLEYLRPNRFRGLMQVASQPSTEVIVVDQSLYMRPTGGKWVNLSGTESAKAVGASLQNALSGSASLDKIGVDPNAIVKKTRDDGRKCDLYKSSVKSQDGTPGELEICADNQLPKFVTMTTQQGPFTFEYYDYNTLFLIEKPM